MHVKYYCSKCNRRRFWSSTNAPLSPIMAASSLMNGFPMTKIVRFFVFLNCAFPSVRRMFYSAQQTVRPIITNYYENMRQTLINNIIQERQALDLSLDGQYDSPGYCAYHCTVTTMESRTRKIIGFKTVKRSEVNNRTPNAEPAACRILVNELLSYNLVINSITTDGSNQLSSLFSTEFPFIKHYLDLWHILHNIQKKFAPKFNRRVRFCLYFFCTKNFFLEP